MPDAILCKVGWIYVNNKYCDLSSLGFLISVSIASSMMQITIVQTSNIIDLILKLIHFISLTFVKYCVLNFASRIHPM